MSNELCQSSMRYSPKSVVPTSTVSSITLNENTSSDTISTNGINVIEDDTMTEVCYKCSIFS